MTQLQMKLLARDIKNLNGLVPDKFRLMFAEIIRDNFQFSKNFPSWNEFKKMCGLENFQ